MAENDVEIATHLIADEPIAFLHRRDVIGLVHI
jgi:hypothetical protein